MTDDDAAAGVTSGKGDDLHFFSFSLLARQPLRNDAPASLRQYSGPWREITFGGFLSDRRLAEEANQATSICLEARPGLMAIISWAKSILRVCQRSLQNAW